MVVDPLYLQHSHSDKAIDYRVKQYNESNLMMLVN